MKSTFSTTTNATIGILFVCLIWGVEFVLIHNAIQFLEPHSFNVLRFGIAALTLAVYLGGKTLFSSPKATTQPPATSLKRMLIFRGAILGLILYLAFTLQTFGLMYTSVSNSSFITSLNITLVPVFAFVLLKDRPHWLTIGGVTIATLGLYFLTSGGDAPFNLGDGLTFLCAIMFALHIIFTGKHSRNHATLPLTVVQLSTVALLSLFSALIFEDWRQMLNFNLLLEPTLLFAIVFVAFLGTAVAIAVQTKAQGYLSDTRVALIFALEPVFAAIAAYLVLGETLPAAAGFGAAMILFGVIMAQLPPETVAEATVKETNAIVEG